MPERLILIRIEAWFVSPNGLPKDGKLFSDTITEMKARRPRQNYDVRGANHFSCNFVCGYYGFGDIRFILRQREDNDMVLALRFNKQRNKVVDVRLGLDQPWLESNLISIQSCFLIFDDLTYKSRDGPFERDIIAARHAQQPAAKQNGAAFLLTNSDFRCPDPLSHVPIGIIKACCPIVRFADCNGCSTLCAYIFKLKRFAIPSHFGKLAACAIIQPTEDRVTGRGEHRVVSGQLQYDLAYWPDDRLALAKPASHRSESGRKGRYHDAGNPRDISSSTAVSANPNFRSKTFLL